jgi:Polyketide cyclase / dehydrase and lipid transport
VRRTPLTTVTKTIELTIDRPVEEVFAFLTDAANHARWDASSLAMEPQEPGPWRAGLTFREVRRIGPRPVEVRSIIAELEPNRRLELRSLSGPPFQGHWRFAPSGSGTRLTWAGELRLAGPLRFFAPLIARSFGKSADANFARLKRILEDEGQAAPSPASQHIE